MRLLRPLVLARTGIGGEGKNLQKEALELARKWLADRKAIAPDVLAITLLVAARTNDPGLFRGLREAAKATTDHRERNQILGVLGAFRDPALIGQALAILLDRETDVRDSLGILFTALYHLDARDLAYDWLKKNFDALVARAGPELAMYILGAPQAYCDEGHRADAAAFFGPRADKIEGAPRVLANALEQVTLCIAKDKFHRQGVEAFLKKL